VTANVWLDTDDRLVPGTEIFRSDRRFVLWAYSASHRRLLLRSPAEGRGTTIDLLFEGVEAVGARTRYDGLVLGRAAPEETERAGHRVFLLETAGRTDQVVATAVGWHEGVLGPTRLSFFDRADPFEPDWPTRPLAGAGGGFNVASAADLVAALGAADDDRPRRERYRMVYVVMTGPRVGSESGTAVFLSRADAEEACARIAPRVPDCWIETLPIAV
jgi:hypothetical protein